MKKPKLVKSDLDSTIAELAAETDKRTLAIWACDCAERVLPMMADISPPEDRPRRAIEAGRNWIRTGIFSMAAIRKASLDAHTAARNISDGNPAHSAARAAGQAVATAHAKGHAVAAAVYAATAVRDSAEPENQVAAVDRERDWQFQHLQDLRSG